MTDIADATDEAPEAEATAEEKPTDDPRITKANQEAARYRRELREAQRELEKIRTASMTEQEKAVAEAEQRGRSAALADTGARLARAEFRAAAAGRLDKEALDGFLEFADLRKFVGDDGEPDAKAIEAAVKKLGGSTKPTNFDGGARTPAAKPNDMNSLIRHAAGVG
jgi:hypothetical protein